MCTIGLAVTVLDDRQAFMTKSLWSIPPPRSALIYCLSIDVSLPTEVDDEYWSMSDPQQPLRQPEGKPSKITFFVCVLRLCQILAFANRTIVSPFVLHAHDGTDD